MDEIYKEAFADAFKNIESFDVCDAKATTPETAIKWSDGQGVEWSNGENLTW